MPSKTILFLALALLALARPALALSCLSDGFETDTGLWTPDPGSLWHRESTASPCGRAHGGQWAWYFGQDSTCTYDNGQVKDSSLTSPPVQLSADPSQDYLSFWTLFEVESLYPVCYDQRWVQVSVAGGPWSTLLDLGPSVEPAVTNASVPYTSGNGTNGPGQWQYYYASLTWAAGSSVQVRFRFLDGAGSQKPQCAGQTPDDSYDGYLGWYVDDVNLGCDTPQAALDKAVVGRNGALTVDKGSAYAWQGDTVKFHLNWANLSSQPQTLQIWDTLPSFASYVLSTPTASSTSGPVVWTLYGVPAWAQGSVTLTTSVANSLTFTGDWLNQAMAESGGDSLTFTSNQVDVHLEPPRLILKKYAYPATIPQGGQVEFDLVLTDASAAQDATQVLVQDSLPANFTFTNSSYWGSGATLSNGVWSLTLPSLAAGDTQALNILGQASGAVGTPLRNTAYAMANEFPWTDSSVGYTLTPNPGAPGLQLVTVYPNPAPSKNPAFAPMAYVVYTLAHSAELELKVFNVAGELVYRGTQPAIPGEGQVPWNLRNNSGRQVASGLYVFRLMADASGSQETVFGEMAVLW